MPPDPVDSTDSPTQRVRPALAHVVEDRANEILRGGTREVRRMPLQRALSAETTRRHDYVGPYTADLGNVIDMEAVAGSKLKIGVGFWEPIADRFGLDIAFGNDPDTDRHGIVTRGSGLLAPNHYLAVAVWYLFQNRPQWRAEACVGKTLVSSSMIDRVAAHLKKRLSEVPVGFKWFVEGLIDGSYGFGGEESAGASFLRRDGTVWCTDKDGIIMNLLAAEILARTGCAPDELYRELEERFGRPVYERIDAAASAAQREALKRLSPEMVAADEIAGEAIRARLTHAPGNGAPIGGLKVVADSAWFAARPSGTEDINKIYA